MKKVLIVLSEYGFWGEELVEPLEILQKAGFECNFATPKGNKPNPVPVSMDDSYIDPPLGRPVTSKETAQKTKNIVESNILDNPLNISKIVPERPYMSAANYLFELEKYYSELEKVDDFTAQYEAILLVGGSGPILDMGNNKRVHDLILSFYKQNKLIAAECYAVTCLAFARDYRLGKSLLKGKNVTGHPKEYDYLHDYGYVNVNGSFEGPPYPLEYILSDAVGDEGQFYGKIGEYLSVILDYPFLTSRSVAESNLCGQVIVKCLKEGIKRFGW